VKQAAPAPGGASAPAGPPAAAARRLVLRKNQDRRLRGGHPWIFSNEVADVQGQPQDGDLVDVFDFRGAFLGRAYYNRRSLICARVVTRGRDEVDAPLFARRFERALRYREQVYPGEAAARLVYGESDQLPGLVVDRYGDCLAVQILTLGMEVRRELVAEALREVLAPRAAVLCADSPLRVLEGLPLSRDLWWGELPEPLIVNVAGLDLEVDLLHGQKTGLFLDQRENRKRLAGRVRGRRVLDAFCYQGEWALHAAREGASEVVGLDGSAPALERARRNAERNGLADRVRFREANVFDELRALERGSERFDAVILDPPALIKSRAHLAAGAKAYRELNRAAMALLSEGGWLFTCSCSHHLVDDLFEQVLMEAARQARRGFRVVEWGRESYDHPVLLGVPETHYLKCAVLQAVA
jgi:23S rRNA (cytosine1962-C5)-methyltransferase